MKNIPRVIEDLERQAYKFWKRGDYYIAYLFFYSLIEGALRDFLKVSPNVDLRLCDLISKLEKFLETPPYAQPKSAVKNTIENLTKFRKNRNKLVHNLWRYGYNELNEESKQLARQAFMTYLLHVEYLGTLNEEFKQRWCVEYEVLGKLKEWLKD